MARRSIPRPQPPVGGTKHARQCVRTTSIRGINVSLTAILERIEEALINELTAIDLALLGLLRGASRNLRLVIALGLLASLLFKPQSLVERIVQLGVRIGNFLLAHECPIRKLVSLGRIGVRQPGKPTQIARKDLCSTKN